MTTTSFSVVKRHFGLFRPLLYHGRSRSSTPPRKFYSFFAGPRAFVQLYQPQPLFFGRFHPCSEDQDPL